VHDSVVLDSEQPRAVYLAEGLGHAFLSLADGTSVTYLVSTNYDPAREFTVSPLDADLDLPWPADVELELSARDRQAPARAESLERGLLPTAEKCTARYAQLRGGARRQPARPGPQPADHPPHDDGDAEGPAVVGDEGVVPLDPVPALDRPRDPLDHEQLRPRREAREDDGAGSEACSGRNPADQDAVPRTHRGRHRRAAHRRQHPGRGQRPRFARSVAVDHRE